MRIVYEREYPREAEIMMSCSQRSIEQGRRQGRQQGKLEGSREGEVMILLRQLKFGGVPEPVRRKIEQADPQTLPAWSERVLTAADIEQVIDD
ncbi:MAG: hypothetical protein [Olavius algarvensis Gamma 1 endosymbiont]|nr:MAG: hypothetical protein [Olavius algarvensis Gamma 1 endosymbiont]